MLNLPSLPSSSSAAADDKNLREEAAVELCFSVEAARLVDEDRRIRCIMVDLCEVKTAGER